MYISVCKHIWRSGVNVLYLLYYSSTLKIIYIYLCIWVCTCIYMPWHTCGSHRTTSVVSSLYHVTSKDQTQAWWQASLPVEPSHWPSSLFFETRSLTEPGHPWSSWLARKLQVSSCLCLTSTRLTDITVPNFYVIARNPHQVLMYMLQTFNQPNHPPAYLLRNFI